MSERPNLGDDPYLDPFRGALDRRCEALIATKTMLAGDDALTDFASGHEHFGLHRAESGGWVFREWAPNARSIHLIGDFSNWEARDEFALTPMDNGQWEIRLDGAALNYGDLYRLKLTWDGGGGDRLPAYARRVVQDEQTKAFNAQVWHPQPYVWRSTTPTAPEFLTIYEAHVGMATEEPKVGSYAEFTEHTLPRIAAAGYSAVQLMAVMEHPYYGSFGYHVANFFAASSRFGTPEELKALVDRAHELGLIVVMDLVHSHAVKNEAEGLSRFDGTEWQYFHAGARGEHAAWDSRCFDYSKPEVLHFLLSNCRYWLDEFRFDGFRFDGVTSMLYRDHGLGAAFTSYDDYFGANIDPDAVAYLGLANDLIHQLRPDAITIAEDVSGMPGLAAPTAEGGCGFDYRLAMGVPDCWFKLTDLRDEDWDLNYLWHELQNRRAEERVISYVESHDQALVGGKSFIFELMDAAMYDAMHKDATNAVVDRGMALHKMARLATIAAAGGGYLNFIGNEFGHPEWVDFPREGNEWSYQYARRQWSLRDNSELRYSALADFDREVMELLGRDIDPDEPPALMHLHGSDQVLAFSRSGFLFVFNFHPTRSFEGYGTPVPRATDWTLCLDSDRTVFGGHARIEPGQHFATTEVEPGAHQVQLYLPARSALVLRNPVEGR